MDSWLGSQCGNGNCSLCISMALQVCVFSEIQMAAKSVLIIFTQYYHHSGRPRASTRLSLHCVTHILNLLSIGGKKTH